jgi:DNA gyrase subunit A
VITISHLGYIKRTPLSEYRRQNRGGVGAKGSNARDEDFLEHLFVATNHNYILLFTEFGKCYWLRVYEIPEGAKTSKGRAIQNLINIEQDDKVKAFINVKDLMDEAYVANNYIVLCTRKGTIKKTSLEAYSRPRQNGIIAINIKDGDSLLEARLTNGNNEIVMALKSGRAIRFPEKTVRPMGRNAAGVRGIKLAGASDSVIGMICLEDGSQDVLVVSENGYGKKSDLGDYRVTNRGGKGVKTINITPKTGKLIAIKAVSEHDDLMIINKSGILIRLSVRELRVMGRATQGVRLINLKGDDSIASVARVEIEDEKEVIENPIEEHLESDTQEPDIE